MNIFKRITTSVSASLDNAVGQIENHDAIVEASIKQTRQAVAKTKARINTLRQQQSVYEKQQVEAREQHQLWTDRATRLAESDQARALQCITRRNQCLAEIERLDKAIPQQQQLVQKVTGNMQKLESQLAEMTQKHNLMRSRQTVADVNRVVGRMHRDEDLQDTFERWEATVLEYELDGCEFATDDPLDSELRNEENDEQLMAQLNELMNKEEPNHE